MGAIVIRHDVSDSEYRANSVELPEIAYLPGEGHGVLITTNWVLATAHATTWRPIHEPTINGARRAVEKVVVHPGYKKLPKEMQSGDATPLVEFLAASDDAALIKLPQPVTDVTPVKIYKTDEGASSGNRRRRSDWKLASSVNILDRLIAANCAAPRRESLVRVSSGWNCSLRLRRMPFRAKVCLPMAIAVRRCCSISGEAGIGRVGLAQIRQPRSLEIPLLCLWSDDVPSPRLPLR